MNYSPKLSVKDFKFGIELELGIDADDLIDDITLYDGWRIHDEHCGSEIVSPPLKGFAGLLIVRRQLKEIWSAYDTINFYDAGLHVHVDIQHYTLKHAKRLLTIGSLFNEVIYAMMDGSRYNNNYARHCDYKLANINKCVTIADLQKLQRHDRYHGINFYAFVKHGTVEFRYAMATADWTRVYSLASMYLRMVAFADSDLVIPKDVPHVPKWNSAGLKFAKRKLAILEKLKNQFLDMLQIRGDVRNVLENMFDENACDTQRPSKDAHWETRKLTRGLKQRKAKTS